MGYYGINREWAEVLGKSNLHEDGLTRRDAMAMSNAFLGTESNLYFLLHVYQTITTYKQGFIQCFENLCSRFSALLVQDTTEHGLHETSDGVRS